MKKIITVLSLAFILSGCGITESVSNANSENAPAGNSALAESSHTAISNDTLVIEERFFVFWMWDIVFNSDNYLGRTIQYEGMFRTLHWDDGYLHQVFRYTEGCCGPDGIIGLEVRLDSIDIEPFPDGAWVEVAGILEEFVEGGRTFVRLEVISIIEMDERGAEFVTAG